MSNRWLHFLCANALFSASISTSTKSNNENNLVKQQIPTTKHGKNVYRRPLRKKSNAGLTTLPSGLCTVESLCDDHKVQQIQWMPVEMRTCAVYTHSMGVVSGDAWASILLERREKMFKRTREKFQLCFFGLLDFDVLTMRTAFFLLGPIKCIWTEFFNAIREYLNSKHPNER